MRSIWCKNISFKNGLRISSFIVNLIEGCAAAFAVALNYTLFFEEDSIDHDVGLGLFVLLVLILVLLISNLFFKFAGKFRIKETLLFQLVPLISGAALFAIYQLVFN